MASVSAFQTCSTIISSSQKLNQGSAKSHHQHQRQNTNLVTLSAAAQEASATASKESDDLARGDARGAAMLLEDISVSRGSSQILSNIDWRIEPKSKFALVGTNGAGKVSFFLLHCTIKWRNNFPWLLPRRLLEQRILT